MGRLRSSALFRRPPEFGSFRDMLFWWEKRRIAYNAIVGVTGLFAAAIVIATANLEEPGKNGVHVVLGNSFVGFFTVIIYGVMANVCYTGGWVSEWLIGRMWPREKGRFGEITFTLGLGFSILLTLVPAIILVPLSIYWHLNR